MKITRDKCRQNCQYFHRRKKETGKGKIAKRGTAIKVILMGYGTNQIKNKNRVKITRDKCRQNCHYFHFRKKETGKGKIAKTLKIAKRGTAIKVILMDRN